MSARNFIAPLLLAASTAIMADEPGYRLSLESSVRDNQLTVAPRITAPAGAQLRYEIVSTKTGAAGKSNTSQSGRVAVAPGGSASLSTLKLGIAAADRYSIVVKVFDGPRLVAEQTLHYPQ